MAYKKLRTPIIKPRTQGGTFYTFSSALEDIGLNINESKNKVALSHYVLLDIPAFKVDKSYGSGEEELNQGDYYFAEQLQNYALNMETIIRNDENYNFAESLTVSERVFWKFMKKQNFMQFTKADSSSSYYIDSNDVVKGFGPITAGAQRTDAYGIYNETYVQIPSSYGKMQVLFKPVSDKNYHITPETEDYYISSTPEGLIENIDVSEYNPDTSLLYTGISPKAIYDDANYYTVNSEDEELCVELSLDQLNEYYGGDIWRSYDDMGIECIGIETENKISAYTFNAILVYYSIYDSTGVNVLATNAYGLLILNSAASAADITSESMFKFPSLEKRQTTPTMSGSSYAFRLNIKTSSVYNGNVIVNDESTAAYEMSTEFNDVIRNLSSVVNILKSNANVIAKISSDNTKIKNLAANSLYKISDIEEDIKTLKNGSYRSLSAASLTADIVKVSTISPKDANGIIINTYNDNSTLSSVVSIADGAVNVSKLIGENVQVTGTLQSERTATNQLAAIDKEIIFTTNNAESPTEIGKMTTNGIYSGGDFYFRGYENTLGENQVDGEMVDEFFSSVDVYMDSALSYHLTLPDAISNTFMSDIIQSVYAKAVTNNPSLETTPEEIPEENEEDNEDEEQEEQDNGEEMIIINKNSFYNLTSLVMLLMAEVKHLSNTIKSL